MKRWRGFPETGEKYPKIPVSATRVELLQEKGKKFAEAVAEKYAKLFDELVNHELY